MSARTPHLRRAAVFGALAVALGLVAVRSVAQREAAIAQQIGPIARIVVIARDVPEDHPLRAEDLAYRQVPLRWVAPRALGDARQAVGLRTAARLDRGTPVLEVLLRSTDDQASDALASGDRVLELVATGSPRLVKGGSRVDVVRTAQRADGSERTLVVAESVEVLEVRAAPESSDGGAEQVSATVRVPRSAALRLAAAQDGGGSLRLLPRASWDKQGLITTP
ncbi:MAG: hypothetical protein JHD16_08440 [Solirubrobacteraceae bacterium]|nr:hypothetical protein [Solirubrobacteraceae bacterium]